MKRPSERLESVIADIATIAGVRAPICMMPVPSLMVCVRPAMKASGVSASLPHPSAVHSECTPRRSASTAKVTAGSQSPGSLPTSPVATRMACPFPRAPGPATSQLRPSLAVARPATRAAVS